jgi:hypothetical protein
VEGTVERSYWIGKAYNKPCPEDFSGATMLAWHAWAEVGSFLAAGFEIPENVIDVAAEYRVVTNRDAAPEMGMNAALRHFGLEPE